MIIYHFIIHIYVIITTLYYLFTLHIVHVVYMYTSKVILGLYANILYVQYYFHDKWSFIIPYNLNYRVNSGWLGLILPLRLIEKSVPINHIYLFFSYCIADFVSCFFPLSFSRIPLLLHEPSRSFLISSFPMPPWACYIYSAHNSFT